MAGFVGRPPTSAPVAPATNPWLSQYGKGGAAPGGGAEGLLADRLALERQGGAGPAPAPAAPAPAPMGEPGGGGSTEVSTPAIQGLQTAFKQIRQPAAGWNDEPMAAETEGNLGNRMGTSPVTTLVEVMRRFGRAY